MTKKASNAVAKVLEKVASKSVKMAADSRCMYIIISRNSLPGSKNFAINKSFIKCEVRMQS